MVTLRASADQADGNYRWYDARNGTPIAGAVNRTYSTAVTQTTTYYVSVREGPCESERVPLEVRVITAPPPGGCRSRTLWARLFNSDRPECFG